MHTPGCPEPDYAAIRPAVRLPLCSARPRLFSPGASSGKERNINHGACHLSRGHQAPRKAWVLGVKVLQTRCPAHMQPAFPSSVRGCGEGGGAGGSAWGRVSSSTMRTFLEISTVSNTEQ